MQSEKEFTWVMSVLNSCKTPQHIDSAENLFECFLNKWKPELSDTQVLNMNKKFVTSKFDLIDRIL
jgi:hypothetical protein